MIEEEDLDVFLKLIVVGNGGIGKSSLIHRYCHGNFANDYKKTIGVDFLEKQIMYLFIKIYSFNNIYDF